MSGVLRHINTESSVQDTALHVDLQKAGIWKQQEPVLQLHTALITLLLHQVFLQWLLHLDLI